MQIIFWLIMFLLAVGIGAMAVGVFMSVRIAWEERYPNCPICAKEHAAGHIHIKKQ